MFPNLLERFTQKSLFNSGQTIFGISLIFIGIYGLILNEISLKDSKETIEFVVNF